VRLFGRSDNPPLHPSHPPTAAWRLPGVTCAQQTTRGRDRGGSDLPTVGAAGSPAAPHPSAVTGVGRRRRRRQRQRERENMPTTGAAADCGPIANAVEPKGGTAAGAAVLLTQPPQTRRRDSAGASGDGCSASADFRSSVIELAVGSPSGDWILRRSDRGQSQPYRHVVGWTPVVNSHDT